MTLDLSSSAQTGYLQTTATDGQVYYYQFSGTTRPDGTLEIAENKGVTKIEMTLRGDGAHPYVFGDIYFPEDPKSQLQKVSVAGTSAAFRDTNDKRQDGYYLVTVIYKDASGNYVSISPDPKIINN